MIVHRNAGYTELTIIRQTGEYLCDKYSNLI